VNLIFDTVTPNSIVFLCYPGWMLGPGLRLVFSSYWSDLFGTFDPIWPQWPWPLTQWPQNHYTHTV